MIRWLELLSIMIIRASENSPSLFLPRKATYPAEVDDADGQAEIADVFADKFHNLYNSVSYNEAEMDILKNDIDNMINVQCTRSSHCIHGTSLLMMLLQLLKTKT